MKNTEMHRKIQVKRAFLMDRLNPGEVNEETVAAAICELFPYDDFRIAKENIGLLFSHIETGKESYWKALGKTKEQLINMSLQKELEGKDYIQKKGYLMRIIQKICENATDEEMEGEVLKQLATGDYEKLYDFLVKLYNSKADIFINEIGEDLPYVKANIQGGAPSFDKTKDWSLDERGKIEAVAIMAEALEHGSYWENCDIKRKIGLRIGGEIAAAENIGDVICKKEESVNAEYYWDYDVDDDSLTDEQKEWVAVGIVALLFFAVVAEGEEGAISGMLGGIETAVESFALPTLPVWWPWAVAGVVVAVVGVLIARHVIKNKKEAEQELLETYAEIEEYNKTDATESGETTGHYAAGGNDIHVEADEDEDDYDA